MLQEESDQILLSIWISRWIVDHCVPLGDNISMKFFLYSPGGSTILVGALRPVIASS